MSRHNGELRDSHPEMAQREIAATGGWANQPPEPVPKCDVTLMIPGLSGDLTVRTHDEALKHVDVLCDTMVEGIRALGGLYLRICDLIRSHAMSDESIRPILERHFSQPRASEILRVARAPQNIYQKYYAGFFGFKAALRQTRGFTITANDALRKQQIRRAAERLVFLAGDSEVFVRVNDRIVKIEGRELKQAMKGGQS